MNKTEGREWLKYAKQDLTTALQGSHQEPRQKCFNAQASEKALKAVLEGISFTKTHDIRQLVNLLPQVIGA